MATGIAILLYIQIQIERYSYSYRYVTVYTCSILEERTQDILVRRSYKPKPNPGAKWAEKISAKS